jgi:hypothetical protein
VKLTEDGKHQEAAVVQAQAHELSQRFDESADEP